MALSKVGWLTITMKPCQLFLNESTHSPDKNSPLTGGLIGSWFSGEPLIHLQAYMAAY